MPDSLIASTEAVLAAAGCVAADEESIELVAFADGDTDRLSDAIRRRCAGEPIAWITGHVRFCGCDLVIETGVYVPRWQSEGLAERAASILPSLGTAVDLGTGSGAVAAVLAARRPQARIIGTETDPVAAECARRNGVSVAEGSMFASVPFIWRNQVDVVVAVLPYVPTSELPFLARDVLSFEPLGAIHGGESGTMFLERAIVESVEWLRPGGVLLLELGGDQVTVLQPVLDGAGFTSIKVIYDAEGDVRGVEAVVAV